MCSNATWYALSEALDFLPISNISEARCCAILKATGGWGLETLESAFKCVERCAWRERLETLHLFHVVISRTHPVGVYHVRSRKHGADKLLQVLHAQPGFLRENMAFGNRLDHTDDEDVADIFE